MQNLSVSLPLALGKLLCTGIFSLSLGLPLLDDFNSSVVSKYHGLKHMHEMRLKTYLSNQNFPNPDKFFPIHTTETGTELVRFHAADF